MTPSTIDRAGLDARAVCLSWPGFPSRLDKRSQGGSIERGGRAAQAFPPASTSRLHPGHPVRAVGNALLSAVDLLRTSHRDFPGSSPAGYSSHVRPFLVVRSTSPSAPESTWLDTRTRTSLVAETRAKALKTGDNGQPARTVHRQGKPRCRLVTLKPDGPNEDNAKICHPMSERLH